MLMYILCIFSFSYLILIFYVYFYCYLACCCYNLISLWGWIHCIFLFVPLSFFCQTSWHICYISIFFSLSLICIAAEVTTRERMATASRWHHVGDASTKWRRTVIKLWDDQVNGVQYKPESRGSDSGATNETRGHQHVCCVTLLLIFWQLSSNATPSCVRDIFFARWNWRQRLCLFFILEYIIKKHVTGNSFERTRVK